MDRAPRASLRCDRTHGPPRLHHVPMAAQRHRRYGYSTVSVVCIPFS
jgi:hypothetical protein